MLLNFLSCYEMKRTGTDPDIPIIFEDDHLLVIDKPHGLLSQEDRTGDPNVLSLCKDYLSRVQDGKATPYLGLLHRLDRPVGGLMILARNHDAARKLNRQFRDQTLQKNYITIAEGKTPVNGVWIHHLAKDHDKNVVHTVDKDKPGSKKAVLSYQQLSVRRNLSLLSIHLQTGRPHQIRVQLAAEGYPVWGDYKYGSPGQPQGRTVALRSYEMSFVHPSTGNRMSLRTTIPNTEPWNYFEFEPDQAADEGKAG